MKKVLMKSKEIMKFNPTLFFLMILSYSLLNASSSWGALLQRSTWQFNQKNFIFLSVHEEELARTDVFIEDNEGWAHKINTLHGWDLFRLLSEIETFKFEVKSGRKIISNKIFSRQIGIEKNQNQNQSQNQIQNHSFGPESISDLKKREDSPGSLWVATNSWSTDWDLRYSNWIKSEVTPEFFKQHKIATDCADVAISLRWIFARIHSLPIASSSGANDRLITNESVNPIWKNLSRHEDWTKDRRFLTALNYVMDHGYTHTLMRDSYPLKIDTLAVREGAVHLSNHGNSGHTQVVIKTNFEPGTTAIPLLAMASTVPRAVRSLFSGMLFAENSKKGTAALIRMRWAQKNSKGLITLLPAEKHPWFSEEQFAPGFMGDEKSFVIAVFRKLNPQFTIEGAITQAYKDVETSLNERIGVVKSGWEFCKGGRCPEKSQAYDDWSTTSRDKRIMDRYRFSMELDWYLDLRSDPELAKRIKKIKESFLRTKLEIAEAGTVTAEEMIWAFGNKLASDNPNMPPMIRWAVGIKGVLGSLQEKINGLLARRSEKVNRAQRDCQGKCEVNSEKFKLLMTLKEDSEIFGSLLMMDDYDSRFCLKFNLKCDDFLSEVKKLTFQIDGQNYGFDEFAKRAFRFGSNPNQKLSSRWGDVVWPQMHFIKDYEGTWSVINSRGRRDSNWLVYASQGVLYNIKSHEKINFPGYVVLSLKQNQVVLVSGVDLSDRSPHEVIVYDLSRRQVEARINYSEELLNPLFQIQSARQNELVFYNKNMIQIYNRENSGVVPEWNIKYSLPINDSKKRVIQTMGGDENGQVFFFGFLDNKGIEFVKISDPSVRFRHDFTAPIDMNFFFGAFQECRSQICLLTSFGINLRQSIFVNLKTMENLKLDGSNSLGLIGENKYLSSVDKGVGRIYLLSPDSSLDLAHPIYEKRNVSQVVVTKDGGFLASIAKGPAYWLNIANSQVHEIPLTVAGQFGKSVENLLLLWSDNQDRKSFIFDRQTGQKVIVSDANSYFNIMKCEGTKLNESETLTFDNSNAAASPNIHFISETKSYDLDGGANEDIYNLNPNVSRTYSYTSDKGRQLLFEGFTMDSCYQGLIGGSRFGSPLRLLESP